jgi:PAS domain S-box-containing protein
MVMIDPDGLIKLVNSECERMFGYERDQLLGKSIEVLVPDRLKTDHRGHRDMFARNPSKRLMGVGRDLRAVRADRSEFPVEIGLTPIETDQGRGVLAFVVDITARREAEKSIAGYMAELERVNERLARFAYVASHDIQEPLRKIAAFSDVLKTAVARSNMDEVVYASDVMQASAKHARALVSGLLNLAHSLNDEYQLSAVSVVDVIDAVISNLSHLIAEDSAVIQSRSEDFYVSADRLQVIELIENIVSNALKYHKPGEKPTIRIGSAPVDGRKRRLWIEDDGIGFDPARGEEIFEPFKRLHSRDEYPGSGIGLAICRTVARRHGWALNATSTPGVGSRFEIVFDTIEPPRG